jgi:hypothetical protein
MKALINKIDLHHLIVIFVMAGLAKHSAEHFNSWQLPIVFTIGYLCGKITSRLKHK